MTDREQWIRDYEFKNEWRRDLDHDESDRFRCWECDVNLGPAQARRFAHYCAPCRAKLGFAP